MPFNYTTVILFQNFKAELLRIFQINFFFGFYIQVILTLSCMNYLLKAKFSIFLLNIIDFMSLKINLQLFSVFTQ